MLIGIGRYEKKLIDRTLIVYYLYLCLCYKILGQALKCWVGDRIPYRSEDCNDNGEDMACFKLLNGIPNLFYEII